MKINLVATGGSIGSRIIDGKRVLSEAATAQIASIIGADKVFDDFTLHTGGVELSDFNRLRKTVERALDGADGVVITHGTDTLAFSSTYLSYAFSSVKIPIVMCSANAPLTDDSSNGFDVLNAAKSFISRGEHGVFVLFKNPGEVVRLHHGARLIPAQLHEDYYFSIGTGRDFVDTGLLRGMDFEIKNNKVLCLFPYVGMNYGNYDVSGYDAVIQLTYHSGGINVSAFNSFAESHKDIPVFLLSGSKRFPKEIFPSNVVVCEGMTHSALYIKLLLGIANNVKDLPAFALKNVCGEIVDMNWREPYQVY